MTHQHHNFEKNNGSAPIAATIRPLCKQKAYRRPLFIDPKDEAYTEACEEIDRLKKIIERLEREAREYS
jgi:hypothetical protein